MSSTLRFPASRASVRAEASSFAPMLLALLVGACSSAGPPPSGARRTSAETTCRACVIPEDCPVTETCVALGDNSVCARLCSSSADCSDAAACAADTALSDAPFTACLAVNVPCTLPGAGDPTTGDAGDQSNAGTPDSASDSGPPIPAPDAGELTTGTGATDSGARPAPDGGVPSTTTPDAGSNGIVDAGRLDTPDAGTPAYCLGYAQPDEVACCTCPQGHSCTADNCYGGYYCDLNSCRCASPAVAHCPGPDAG